MNMQIIRRAGGDFFTTTFRAVKKGTPESVSFAHATWSLSICFMGVAILSKGALGDDIAIKMDSLMISNELTPIIDL